MTTPFFQGVPLKAKALGVAIILIPLAILVLLGAIFLRPDPIDQRLVWGCYVAEGAPALAVEADQIHILDGGRRFLNYVAEPYKQGYRLTVRPALQLKPSIKGRYVFVQSRGMGYFWPLLAEGSDDPRRVRSPGDFGGRLSLIAADGRPVVYVRSRGEIGCR